MIKMVVSDVDGTLVKEGSSTINPEYYEVIRALHKQGVQTVIASGRQFASIYNLMKPVDDIIWYIAEGGCCIRLKDGLRVLKEIPRDWVEECWEDIRNIPELDGVASSLECSFAQSEEDDVYKMLKDNYRYEIRALQEGEPLPDVPIPKFALFRYTDIEKYVNQFFIPKWQGKLHMAIAGEWWLDCMMPGVNKGAALRKAIEQAGILPEEVMAAGDNMNDLEMLKVAGVSLTFDTAPDKVKEACTKIIPGFAEDGVLQEWKKLLK